MVAYWNASWMAGHFWVGENRWREYGKYKTKQDARTTLETIKSKPFWFGTGYEYRIRLT